MEGIQESLKNAILVLMADKIIIEPVPEDKDISDIWDITWLKVREIFPSLKDELIK